MGNGWHEITDELNLMKKDGAQPIWQVEELDLKISTEYYHVGAKCTKSAEGFRQNRSLNGQKRNVSKKLF